MAKEFMKYLGVMLDDRMAFGQHLEYVGEKVGAVSRALHRITPNLRGPSEKRRLLYMNVVLSVILYAAGVEGHHFL